MPLTAVIDCVQFFLPDGAERFTAYAQRFYHALPFALHDGEESAASEAFTLRCWEHLIAITISGHYQHFMHLTASRYTAEDQEKFMHEMETILASYPRAAAAYIAELSWKYHLNHVLLREKVNAATAPTPNK